MKWYAAHLVMVVRFKTASQRRFPVWENIVLLQAASPAEAFTKAESLGRAEGGDDDDSFRWDGKRATWEFAGVRKVVACSMANSRPSQGDEISYNELSFDSLLAVRRFAEGLPATARYDEQLPEFDVAGDPGDVKGRRKRA